MEKGQEASTGYHPPAEELAIHEKFELWMRPHLSPSIVALPYSPEAYPHQRFDVVHIAPENPSVGLVRQVAEASFGKQSFESMVEKLQSHPGNILEVAKARLAYGKSTLMATAHVKNVLDTAIFEAVTFAAFDDDPIAERSGIVVNRLMSRLAFKAGRGEGATIIPIIDLLATMGHVHIGIPPGQSAKRLGINEETLKQQNLLMMRGLVKQLKEGMILHLAPSGTVAKPKLLADGTQQLMVPGVNAITAKLISEYAPNVIGAAIDIKEEHDGSTIEIINQPGSSIVHPTDVHDMMHDLVAKTAEMTGTDVVYEGPSKNLSPEVLARIGNLATDKP